MTPEGEKMKCPDESELQRRTDGELGGSRLRKVDEHLSKCDICSARIAEIDKLGGVVRRALSERIDSDEYLFSSIAGNVRMRIGDAERDAAERSPGWLWQLRRPAMVAVYAVLMVALGVWVFLGGVGKADLAQATVELIDCPDERITVMVGSLSETNTTVVWISGFDEVMAD